MMSRIRRSSTLLLCALALAGLGPVGCGGDETGAGSESGADTGRNPRPSGGRPSGGGSDDGDGDPEGGADAGTSEQDAGLPLDDVVATPDADPGETGTIPDVAPVDTSVPFPEGSSGVRGTVWVPGNAPGMVPAGQEIPVSGALVYLTSTAPPPIPPNAYCAACVAAPARAVLTDAGGRFDVGGFIPGDYILVIEKGQFRRQVNVTLTEAGLMEIPATDTTLPSRNAPSEGLFTPRIALAVGASDHLEDIMGKMDLGDVDSDGRYMPMSSTGIIDLYDNGGSAGGAAVGDLGELVQDLGRLSQYHILFIPCSGDGYANLLNNQAVLRNLREYVALGGNLYVTDWSGEWADNVFPAQMTLGEDGFGGIFGGSGIDTPASAYNAATGQWSTGQFGNADGSSYDTPNAEVLDPTMFAWMNGQQGPTAESSSVSTYNAASFEITGNWNFIESVNSVVVGTDSFGANITDTPKVWVQGGQDLRPTPKRPMTVSFEPAGCGRVLYSTYHTTQGAHLGLVPQERVLLYLIMEIGTCRNPKV